MLSPQYSNYTTECGTDEAGRGCLAGPVTAAAVILNKDFKSEILNDSKQVSVSKRNQLRKLIEQEALAYHVVHIMMDKIDEINILNASILAMHKAIEGLQKTPEFIAVDGNKFKPFYRADQREIPHQCIVKGDGKFLHIAAASILAKTYRDEFMAEVHEKFPAYNWKKNKGYPTKEHREALKAFGPTPYHRRSFQLLPSQLKLKF